MPRKAPKEMKTVCSVKLSSSSSSSRCQGVRPLVSLVAFQGLSVPGHIGLIMGMMMINKLSWKLFFLLKNAKIWEILANTFSFIINFRFM